MRLNMVEVISEVLTEKKEDYLKLSKSLTKTPLEKSIDIDNIIAKLNLDIVKILKFNRI